MIQSKKKWGNEEFLSKKTQRGRPAWVSNERFPLKQQCSFLNRFLMCQDIPPSQLSTVVKCVKPLKNSDFPHCETEKEIFHRVVISSAIYWLGGLETGQLSLTPLRREQSEERGGKKALTELSEEFGGGADRHSRPLNSLFYFTQNWHLT